MLIYICCLRGHAPLAQLDRASGYGPEGQEFESLAACQSEIIRTLSSLWEGRVRIIYFFQEVRGKISLVHLDILHYLHYS